MHFHHTLNRAPVTDPEGPSLLRLLRISRGLRQSDLARQAGCAVNTIGRLETGQNTPHLSTARRIAAVLEVDVEVIFPS
jgi:DNA-binding XRE family transcriptional regulator